MKKCNNMCRARLAGLGLCLCLVVWTMGTAATAMAQASDNDTYKADFIVKLANYCEWPAGKGPDASGAITIGVIGTPSCLPQLKAAAAARAADGKKTDIKELAIGDAVTGCHILFFQTCDKSELAQILKRAGSQPVLTVADCAGFAKFGAHISFFDETVDGKPKVKFEVNTLSVGDAQLKLSSNLLKLARII